ncbi:MAG: polymer-forming cytoskeletal protein [Candidatus Omnitrophota bacterium]
MFKKRSRGRDDYLEIEAGMKGTLEFKNPVKLRINGEFEGSLSTKGILVIGEDAVVCATVEGDSVIIFGTFSGELMASKEVKLAKTSRVDGHIIARSIIVEEGALFNGTCEMIKEKEQNELPESSNRRETSSQFLTIEEVSHYLEVDASKILEWINSGKIPCSSEGGVIKFRKQDIDDWVEDNILR